MTVIRSINILPEPAAVLVQPIRHVLAVGEEGASPACRRFSQQAGAGQNSSPKQTTAFKAGAHPTNIFSLQDTPSHIHNGFKTCFPRSAPNCQAIGCFSRAETHLCLCSASWCNCCSQGGCHLSVPADPWYQDD